MQEVKVLRQPRPAGHYKQVAEEAEAEVHQCRAEVRQLRAERRTPPDVGPRNMSPAVWARVPLQV